MTGAAPARPPRVDFYLLREEGDQARDRFVCRLAEKAWRSGHRVYVHVPDGDAARQLDRLMWSYRQDSFLPHEPYDPAAQEPVAPVLIGSAPAGPAGGGEVLVNTAGEPPSFYRDFTRVAEVITADDRDAGRERYRRYREDAVDLHLHEL